MLLGMAVLGSRQGTSVWSVSLHAKLAPLSLEPDEDYRALEAQAAFASFLVQAVRLGVMAERLALPEEDRVSGYVPHKSIFTMLQERSTKPIYTDGGLGSSVVWDRTQLAYAGVAFVRGWRGSVHQLFGINPESAPVVLAGMVYLGSKCISWITNLVKAIAEIELTKEQARELKLRNDAADRFETVHATLQTAREVPCLLQQSPEESHSVPLTLSSLLKELNDAEKFVQASDEVRYKLTSMQLDRDYF